MLGIRKPDPRIFQVACKELGVLPEECVFLDDIGLNLKSAKQLGMQTIKVQIEDASGRNALRKLEEVLNIRLLADGDALSQKQRQQQQLRSRL